MHIVWKLRMVFSTGPIARSTLGTSGVLGVRLLVQAGTLLIVAHMLGAEKFGAFSAIAALAILLGSLSTFGMHLVFFREVAQELHRREKILPYMLTTIFLVGAILLALYLPVTFLLLPSNLAGFQVVLALGIAEILLQPLILLAGVEHHAQGRIERSQILMILPLAFRLLVAALVLLVQPYDPLLVFAWGYLVATLVALMIVLRMRPEPWPLLSSWRLPRRTELKHAAGYAVIGITTRGPTELDKAIAVKLLSMDTAGIYAAGTRVIGALILPVMAMMLAALPRLVRDGVSDQSGDRNLLRMIFGISLGYGLLVAVGLWLAASAIAWLFGIGFDGLDEMLRWLALAVPGLALRIAAGNALVAIGYTWVRATFELIGVMTMIATAIILVPRMPVSGMPMALACSEWCMAVVGWVMLSRTRSH